MTDAKISCILVLLFTRLALSAEGPKPSRIDWQEWSPSIFEKARAEKKFVLLDLHAVWCHWCHVMDEKTYSDPRVIDLMRSKYIAVSVDSDSRPDLANRYSDYGWPATVIYAADQSEIAKQRGYIPPERMISLLQAVINDPSPGPSVVPDEKVNFSHEASLSASLRAELQKALVAGYDEKFGSWGTGQKYLNWDNVEYCIVEARSGNARLEKMARLTLSAQMKLLDPAWGGVYQYSTDGDWDHPHFEKIIQFQAENLRIYAQAFQLWKNRCDLQAAMEIHRFVRSFLTSPDGGFYTSQDADVIEGQHAGEYFKLNDAERRKRGIPHVDTHLYARENGWMIYALAQLTSATGDAQFLNEALRATKYMIQERSMPSGGWRHDASNQAGPYLGDALFMGRAFLGLYAITADRDSLYRAEDAAKFIIDRCQPSENSAPGIVTCAYSASDITDAKPEFDENVAVARFANLLSYYTDNGQYRKLAECAMRYTTTPEVARQRASAVGGLLLADMEMGCPPLHIVVVGPKENKDAARLFAAAVRYPSVYKQIEWQDLREEALHKDIVYPTLPQPAIYLCTGNVCSAPIFKPEDLAPRVNRLFNKARFDSPR